VRFGETESYFSPRYREIAASVIADPPSPVVRPAMPERLLRCLWFDQAFDDVLRTEAGAAVTVLSPGWWNLEAGPDFKNASIKISGGRPARGDVETHVYASGWRQHGHQDDRAYDNVVLHVVMWNDTGQPTTPQGDRDVPILALDRYVDCSVDELTERLDPAEYPHASETQAGRCQELLADAAIDPDWIGQFLDHAGDERIIRKAERFAEMPEAKSPESVLYVSLMEAAGFKQNKRPMGRLARQVPLDRAMAILADGDIAELQAALFGMAGLIPGQLDLPGAEEDSETAAYVGQLRRLWEQAAVSLDGTPLPKRMWQFGGTRPANYPTRRIAAVSRLLELAASGGGLLPTIETELRRAPAKPSRRIARSPAAKAIIELLTGLADEYWSWRSTFGGRRTPSATKLIGKNRAVVMFVDAIVPIVLANARAAGDKDLENRLHRAYATLPRLPGNSVQRFMAARLFGGEAEARAVVNSARRQQGLMQLFRDYCEPDAAGCRKCAFAKALDRGT
jgi:hypothetical protein